ncbi:lipocalin family protein [Halovulum dunhuangense]|uniref:Outer membrane lipoprotein Blc n=1 Tax=Halovulum dunhuangense TaxID=1505036 RepID=A0A849L5R1_9RHOB|nr:lipocalin family protein [Halovulum dunhuangense]NNU81457.1 lipocalin family protein [Halovulum dunhuangense]
MLRRYLLPCLVLTLAACGLNGNYRDTSIPMESVAQLDTERYLGLWYEIARFPNRFEEGCVGVTAEYGLLENGRISVTNSCRQGTLDGELEVAEGSARIAAPGQLKVKFVEWLPFEGDYWVIGLSEDYSVSVVGVPSGDFGWILAREPQISDEALAEARAVLERFGYDTSRLSYTLQEG